MEHAVAQRGKSRPQMPKRAPAGALYCEFFSWVETIVLSLVAVSLVFTFVVRIIRVDGDSMLPTLQNNNVLLISPFLYEVEQGDIVVLNSHEDEKLYIKRVIATEGQVVNIDFDSGTVFVDGVPLDEPYINEATALRGDEPFPQTVQPGHYFVMGDNRNHSEDSRFSSLGQVAKQDIVGEAYFRLLPFGGFGKVG